MISGNDQAASSASSSDEGVLSAVATSINSIPPQTHPSGLPIGTSSPLECLRAAYIDSHSVQAARNRLCSSQPVINEGESDLTNRCFVTASGTTAERTCDAVTDRDGGDQ